MNLPAVHDGKTDALWRLRLAGSDPLGAKPRLAGKMMRILTMDNLYN